MADHNNEGGSYITHIYVFDEFGNKKMVAAMSQIVKTDDYVNSLYFNETDANFDNNGDLVLSSNYIYNNFTYEFDAKPNTTTLLYNNGEYALTVYNSHNFIINEKYGGINEYAGIGLAIGTNGAIAIAHRDNYYYVLLNYRGDLSAQHRYRFTIKNNVPYLHIDGKLIATGILPLSPVTTLFTNNQILNGSYGSYKGYANNFVLYNTAR